MFKKAEKLSDNNNSLLLSILDFHVVFVSICYDICINSL